MYVQFLQLHWPLQMFELFAIFLARASVIAGLSTAWIKISSWAEAHRIIAPAQPAPSLWHDVIDGIGILAIDSLVTVIGFQTGWLNITVHSSLLSIALTFAGLFVWLEIFFYYSHRLLHTPRLFWIHRRHHELRATNPWTSLSFSVKERLVLLFGSVVIPGLVSQFVPLSIEGFLGYFLFNYIFNVFGHLNVEVVPHGFVKTRLGRVFFTPTFHALHHARGRGHFGLFTQTLDRWHKTQFKDYESVHLKASSSSLS